MENTPNVERMPFGVWVAELSFRDGTRVELGKSDVVLVVGPNNAGKTTVLAELYNFLDIANYTTSSVVAGIRLVRTGDVADLQDWVARTAIIEGQPTGERYFRFRQFQTSEHNIINNHSGRRNHFDSSARLYVDWLRTDTRLSLVSPTHNVAFNHPADHPFVTMLREPESEKLISDSFEAAFGKRVYVHRNAGGQIPLHVGDWKNEEKLQLLDPAYYKHVAALPLLHEQGDGMRSFAGVLVHTAVGPRPLLLIDEPEAFLHPPQARYLGQALIKDAREPRQIFLATHSGDVVKGVLDTGSPNVRVIRLQRVGNSTQVRELDPQRVAEIWRDPLLRYSNVLDGLFHEKVVVCESDGDCQFYSAVLHAANLGDRAHGRPHDLLFVQTGGKSRAPVVVRALRAISVPTSAIFDFDLLNDENLIAEVVDSFGGSWGDLKTDWKVLKNAIDQKRPELTIESLRQKISDAMQKWSTEFNLKAARSEVSNLLKRASPWAEVKTGGLNAVPRGDAFAAADRLLTKLDHLGIHVVPVGELEQFCKSIGNHGPAWVNEVLGRNLAADPELQPARDFVRKLLPVM
jgi:hypothetical protein